MTTTTKTDDELRDEVVAWLRANLPEAWVAAVDKGDDDALRDAAKGFDQQAFLRELGRAGYAQPTWETAHGGLGLDADPFRILSASSARWIVWLPNSSAPFLPSSPIAPAA